MRTVLVPVKFDDRGETVHRSMGVESLPLVGDYLVVDGLLGRVERVVHCAASNDVGGLTYESTRLVVKWGPL